MEVGSTREKDKNKQKSETPKPPFVIAKDDTKPVLQDPLWSSDPTQAEEAVLRLPPFPFTLRSNAQSKWSRVQWNCVLRVSPITIYEFANKNSISTPGCLGMDRVQGFKFKQSTKSAKPWMGIQAIGLTKLDKEGFIIPKIGDYLKWKKEDNVFRRAIRGRQRSNEHGSKLIRINEFKDVKEHLTSMYKEIT
ncbi:hypothetical protein Cgig2_015839 [Carnegiea gigantea]|uniref:Uncharacterized protein n=1 Tax=Carnegiea gigantea TaxID=171969 RepID=A0A9Q1KIB4_9CARY|nr:hypothetical protein Cgig2_015839 [Carnegiea gigantea]